MIKLILDGEAQNFKWYEGYQVNSKTRLKLEIAFYNAPEILHFYSMLILISCVKLEVHLYTMDINIDLKSQIEIIQSYGEVISPITSPFGHSMVYIIC